MSSILSGKDKKAIRDMTAMNYLTPEALRSVSEKIDVRPTKLYGNRFSPEVYLRTHLRVPHRLDTMGNMFDKMWKLKAEYPEDLPITRYGWAPLTALVAGQGAYMVKHYRRYFRLQHYGQYSMYFSAAGISCFLVIFMHFRKSVIQIPMQGNDCLPCNSVNYSLRHTLVSMAYPVMACGLMAPYIAHTYGTIDMRLNFVNKKMDSIRQAMKLMSATARKGNFFNVTMMMLFLNLAGAYFISYQQQTEFIKLYGKILKEEQEIADAEDHLNK